MKRSFSALQQRHSAAVLIAAMGSGVPGVGGFLRLKCRRDEWREQDDATLAFRSGVLPAELDACRGETGHVPTWG